MRVISSAASELSPPGRFSTTAGCPSCSASAAPMMRVVGSAEPPGGKPTIKRIGLFGYCADAAPLSSRTNASAQLAILAMATPCWRHYRPEIGNRASARNSLLQEQRQAAGEERG